MGIRFRCPNGHKIHVKSFLAGRRGICPKCGTALAIPAESAPEFAERNRKLAPRSTPVDSPVSPASDVVVAPPTHAEPALPELERESIEWFVRPASGGQFGPASDAVLREWVAQGRVSADALLWRDGWPEWKPAQAVLRDLVPEPQELPTFAATEVVTWTAPTRPVQPRRRKPAARKTLTLVVLLGLACLALFAALVYVVGFRK
jgi:hypothetical protein